MAVKIAMAGALGRMGKSILRLAYADPQLKIVGGLEASSCSQLGEDLGRAAGFADHLGIPVTDNVRELLQKADVVIDFTHASVVTKTLSQVAKAGVNYVIGTTGLGTKDLIKIKTAAKKIGIVQAPNMSIGVNLLYGLADLAARVLDESYDAEIAEIHHRGKKDAPSGTAMKLLDVIAAARKKNADKDAVFGRKGDIGARPKGEIGVLALRGGDVVGDHTISFLGDGERIEPQ